MRRAIAIASAALALAGCGKDTSTSYEYTQQPIPEGAETTPFPTGKSGALMVETIVSDIATLNPLVSEDVGSSAAIGRFSESLVTLDPRDGNVIPSLANSWTISEDGLTYEFQLRKGLFWSDGAPFTADDVLFTWQSIYAKEIDPETGEPAVDEQTNRPKLRYATRAAFFHMINGQEPAVEKIDDHTVRFTTPEPYAPFLLFGGGQNILPRHKLEAAMQNGSLLEQWGIDTAQKEPWEIVGMGAFVVESYRAGERIVFKRNPNYWKINGAGERLPYIERIIAKIVADGSASNLAFAQGFTDIEGISPDNVSWIKARAQAQDYTIEELGPAQQINFVWFNLNPGANSDGAPYIEPHKLAWFQDKRFRQAVSYGINREGIISGVYFGRATAIHNYVSPARKAWFNPNAKTYSYSPDKSRELLRTAGFSWEAGKLIGPKGNPVEFRLITNKSNNMRTEMATVLKENLAALGMTAELQFMDFNNIVKKTSNTFDYECCLLGLGGGAPDPYASKDILMSAGRMHMWNPSQPEPATEWEARIDNLMLKIGREMEYETRRDAFFEIQDILAEQQPFIFLVTPNSYVGYKNRWNNMDPTPLGGATWNIESLWAEPQE